MPKASPSAPDSWIKAETLLKILSRAVFAAPWLPWDPWSHLRIGPNLGAAYRAIAPFGGIPLIEREAKVSAGSSCRQKPGVLSGFENHGKKQLLEGQAPLHGLTLACMQLQSTFVVSSPLLSNSNPSTLHAF